MEKIRFGIIGGGWRARFFITIAKQLPDRFEITNVMLRNPEKAEALSKELNIPTCTSFEELMASKPEYVIVSLPRAAAPEYLHRLMEADMPIFCETPPAGDLEGLKELWSASQRHNAKFQVAEQYFARPMIAAALKVVDMGLLGEVSYVEQGIAHGYHGISLLRKFLGIGMENCEIIGQKFTIPTLQTGARRGEFALEEQTLRDTSRDLVAFRFDGGKNGVFNFSGEQYHSTIRHSRIQVQGPRGEMIDNEFWWLTDEGLAASAELTRKDLGINYNLDGYCHRRVMLGEHQVYRNNYMPGRLGDDEIAIAYMMENMGLYVRGEAEPCYPLEEALQDAYLDLCMGEALKTGKAVRTETQIWG